MPPISHESRSPAPRGTERHDEEKGGIGITSALVPMSAALGAEHIAIVISVAPLEFLTWCYGSLLLGIIPEKRG